MVNENTSATTEKKETSIFEHSTSLTQNRYLRMKQGNIVSISQIPFTPDVFKMCEEMELVEVKKIYAYDSTNKPILDKVEAIAYTCMDGRNWFTFRIPNQIEPAISQEEIDSREAVGTPVIVKIPLDKIMFKAYQQDRDFGILHISLKIPYIEVL